MKEDREEKRKGGKSTWEGKEKKKERKERKRKTLSLYILPLSK